MSHALMRGTPTTAQLYLDRIIEELVAETGRQEDRYCINKILFKCFRDRPHDIAQIEGHSGKVDTNRSLLQRSVRTALALQDAGLQPGDTLLIITRNSVEFTGVYFGAMFAGVVLFFLHVGINAYELKHFIKLRKPDMIFIENESLSTIEQVIREIALTVKVILFGQNESLGHESFSSFISRFDNGITNFWPVDTQKDTIVIIASTSGTTGLPKAAALHSQGFVAQLPSVWTYHTEFPRPSGIYLCTTNPSWLTHTVATTACAAFGVTILFTSAKVTSEHVRHLLRKYKPTISLMPGHLGSALTTEPGHEPGDFKSLDTLWLGGCAIPQHLLSKIQIQMRPQSKALSAYGTTELHGALGFPRPDAPLASIGSVINVIDYKIVDEQGNKLGPNQPGELLLKSNECMFKEYCNNDDKYKEAFAEDGWFRTGDKVYVNEHEDLFFVDRLKFLIKYQNHHISPSEVEEVITKVEGVHSAAVCDSPKGPAALVVLQQGSSVTPQQIHDAVNSTLSDVKKLRGGVVMVPSIPLSVNGKTERKKVKEIFEGLTADQLYYDK